MALSIGQSLDALTTEHKKLSQKEFDIQVEKYVLECKLKSLQRLSQLNHSPSDMLPSKLFEVMNGLHPLSNDDHKGVTTRFRELFAQNSGAPFAESPSSLEIIKIWENSNQYLPHFPDFLAQRQIELRMLHSKPICEEAIKHAVHALNDVFADKDNKWFLSFYNDKVYYYFTGILNKIK